MSTWIFQASPLIYKNVWDVLKNLKNNNFNTIWAAKQNSQLMESGDKVYLWIAGENAGIHAYGHLTSRPYRVKNFPDDFYVNLKITSLLGEDYLTRKEVKNDLLLSKLPIVTVNTGTNFLIKNINQIKKIEALIKTKANSTKNISLKESKIYSKEELESAFSTQFENSINIRKSQNGLEYIILFSKENEYRTDTTENGYLFCVDEGQQNDQEATKGNKALTEARDDERNIFIFKAVSNKYQYQGVYGIDEYFTAIENSRKIYTFKLYKKVLNIDFTKRVDIKEIELKERQTRMVEQKVREPEFRKKIKLLFDYRCVFCNARRLDENGNPEVEAAHILPVKNGGTDSLNNGLALCRLHHWAFDRNLIMLDEALIISVKTTKIDEGFDAINNLDGKKLSLPKNRIHDEYIKNIKDRNSVIENYQSLQ